MSQPSPEQIENMVKRIAGTKNYKGPEAIRRIHRHQLDPNKHKDVFDCDARADIAIRIALRSGYKGRTAVQRIKDQGIEKTPYHRYVILTDEHGVEHRILGKS